MEKKQLIVKAQTPCVFFQDVIPHKLVDLMVEEIEKLDKDKAFVDAKTGALDKAVLDSKTRNSKITWWYESHWVSSIFAHYIGIANKQQWEYDLNTILGVQVAKYEAPDGHYRWHSDYGTSQNSDYTRKLSASLLVTDPSEYEGGDLEFIDYHGNNVFAPKTKGSIIVFDSRVPHRVTPVTKGLRYSLVTWIYGPKLK